MCGIVGVLGPDKAVAEVSALRALGTIRHRGPDDFGHATIRLGHQWLAVAQSRLAIIDLTQDGRQPMVRGSLPAGARGTQVSGDDEVGLVFNGEIYNYPELLSHLKRSSPPQQFRSRCDTEAILHGIAREGLDFVQHLRGMFAIALWEPKTARLHLVRDRLGIKPLYYAQAGEYFLFGSEVRALLATNIVRREVDPVGLERFLTFGACQDPYTMIEGVRALEPSHSLTVENGKAGSRRRYWQLPVKANRTITYPEAVEETRRLLREAVEGHLLADVRVGAFLSGGVDSSVIVAMMAEAHRGAKHAITVVSDDGQAESRSEAGFASLVTSRYGVEHHILHVSAGTAEAHTRRALEMMDQPSIDGQNTFLVSGAAREVGCTVALSGLGADEVFNGYPSFQTLPRWRRLARLAGAGTVGELLRRFVPPSNVRGTKLAEMLASSGDLAKMVAVQRSLFVPAVRDSLIRTEMRAPAGASVTPFLSPEEIPDDPLNCISAFELRGYLQNMLLRDADVMSMAHGLELRVPFLDHKLVEFALSLPGSFRSTPFQRKSLLLNATKSLLPPAVYKRPKMGFNLALPQWMRTTLRERIEQKLLREGPVLNTPTVSALWQTFMSGDNKLWSRLWGLYTMQSWLDRHVFEPTMVPVETPQPNAMVYDLRSAAQ